MTNRSRAWRRRKARLIVGKIRTTKNWLIKQFEKESAEAEAKHRPVKVRKTSRAQDLRRAWQIREDLADGTAG
jgi:hypothetical protein